MYMYLLILRAVILNNNIIIMCTLSRSAGQDGRVNNLVDTTFDRIRNSNVLKYPQVRIYKRSSQELV